MASYLERYLNGEHEQVWAELQALGEGVRAEPVYEDALAVARETMRRARHNVEMLIPRLVAVGYQFGYGWVQPFVRDWLLYPHRTSSGKTVQPSVPDEFSFHQRGAYEERLDLAKDKPPLFTPADDREQSILHWERLIAQAPATWGESGGQLPHWRIWEAEQRARPTAKELLRELEVRAGLLPLSVRAWYELVGAVNFVGDHPGWRAILPESAQTPATDPYDYVNPMEVLDPLVVQGLDQSVVAHYPDRMSAGPGRAILNLWQDRSNKYFDFSEGGGAQVILPSATMDADAVRPDRPRFPNRRLLVPYLREVFRWGGFPGWATLEKRPEEDLAFLTEKLLPL